MELFTIDATLLKKIFLAGVKRLEQKKEWINELNVFPVPDGDTGTNMTMTIMSAANEVLAIDEINMHSLCKAISSGSLKGARGNSGVILSQLLRGFTKAIQDSESIDAKLLAKAFVRATETAYKAVMKPKEGTILTVAKGMSDKAVELAENTKDIIYMTEEIVKEGEEVLARTPELLPVLKQAGVVDSGGQGLMEIIKGAYDALIGKEVPTDIHIEKPKLTAKQLDFVDIEHIETANIKFGYCTEFIVMLDKEFSEDEETKFKEYLASIGDSIVCVSDDEVIKIHVHTNDPGLAMQRGLTYGALTRIKVDNMRLQNSELLSKNSGKITRENAIQTNAQTKKEPEKEYGFISVSVGKGMSETFTGIGVDYLIEGGQTMNPSTEDILEAIEKVNASTIYVLPNNKNIILAANQAAKLTKNKKIIVVPSKTIPQGIAAVIAFMPDRNAEENLEVMVESIKHVKTAQVTYAIRNTNIDGFEIHENDVMVLGDKGMLSVGNDLNVTTFSAFEKLIDEDSELISIYYGKDIDEKVAVALQEKLAKEYPDVEVELTNGGQPVYYYMISVE